MDSSVENGITETTKKLDEISLEDIQLRHRRERKELQSKIQELKKNAPKSDKKKRKEALEQIAKLEADLEKTQLCELEQIKSLDSGAVQEVIPNGVTSSLENSRNEDHCEENQKQRVTKAQKRRDKKERAAKQREDDIKASLVDDIYAPKAIEAGKLESILKQRQLSLFNIPSDGDCLYNAVRHQLLQRGLSDLTIHDLRNLTADYIKLNKNSLLPYMTDPESGSLLTDAEFDKYCDDIRYNSSWGGQIELKALSCSLKVHIEVLQADGSPIAQGAEFESPPLIITYHRHLYSLGEHYNSTIPRDNEGDEE